MTEERAVILSDPEWWRKAATDRSGTDRLVYVRLSMNVIGEYQIRAEYHLDTPAADVSWITNHTNLARARAVMVTRGYERVDTLGPGPRPL